MAVDTRQRRTAAINPSSPWRAAYPNPDGDILLGDRATLALIYPVGALQPISVRPPYTATWIDPRRNAGWRV